MARRRVHSRYFEVRHDSAGRANWYQLQLPPGGREWEPVRVARPARFLAGDRLLDLTADAPSKARREGGEWVAVPLSQRALRYWVENRIPPSQRRLPAVERARAQQMRLIRAGVDPDRIAVFQVRADGSTRRFSVSSYARFEAQERYKKARAELEDETDYWVLGIMGDDGDIEEEIEELD